MKAIKEAIERQREGALDHLNLDLPGSPERLSRYLSQVDQRENALEAVNEAASIRRRPTEKHYGSQAFVATLNSDLADSLQLLSLQLREVGCQEDSVQIIQEAVTFERSLVADYPAYNAKLTLYLKTILVTRYPSMRQAEPTSRHSDSLPSACTQKEVSKAGEEVKDLME